MDRKQITLSQFFGLKSRSNPQVSALVNSQTFHNLKQKIAEESPGVTFPESYYNDLFEMMLEKLGDLLDIDLLKGVFIPAWRQHPDLQEYRDLEKHPPGETALVPLVEHSITTSHAPTIEPTLAGRSLGEIEFEVEGEFLIKGAILEVRDAKIMKVRFGGIHGTGTLGLAGVSFLDKSGNLDISGNLDLQEAVPIGDLPEDQP
jgi:hypothetical protein